MQGISRSSGQKPARGEVIESLEKKCETLCGQYDELKAKIEKLPQGAGEKQFVTKKNIASLKTSVDNCNSLVDNLRSRMDKAKGKCRTIFLCAIVFFCATVAGCVICCPGYFGGVVSLPWYGIVTLITCTLLDIVGTCVWLCDYYSSVKRYSKTGNIVFTFVVEVIVMVLTVLAMWFFGYHPLTEVRGASIWLTVLLGCANLVIFVLRLMYLIWDHSYVYIDFKSFGFCAQLCGVAFAVGSAIALIVAMVA